MDGERQQPLEFFGDYPHGAYWSAREHGDTSEKSLAVYVVQGTVIRLMWDYGVRVPLWDAEGLLPEEPDWLRHTLGLSETLIDSLRDWGEAMIELDAKTDRPSATASELNNQGQHLASRLQRELGDGFTVDCQAR